MKVPESKSVTLIGFSKGVVVLNQILREFSTLSAHGLALASMVWLDGGHNGGRDIWPTDRRLLHRLAEAGVKVEVRVSPYQVRMVQWQQEEVTRPGVQQCQAQDWCCP